MSGAAGYVAVRMAANNGAYAAGPWYATVVLAVGVAALVALAAWLQRRAY